MGKTKPKPAPKPMAAAPPPPAEVQTPAPPRPADLAAGLLPLARIRASSENPRKTFDDLAELTASVRTHGILQPILVRPVGPAPKALGHGKGWSGVDFFEVVAGERRFRAAAAAGLAELPVVVRFLSDAEARPLRHVENGQREPVRVSEEARAVAEWAAGGTPAEEIATQIGKPVAAVRALVRLARLPAWALAAVDAGTLPRATAELVARVPGEESRKRAAACVLLGYHCSEDVAADDWVGLDSFPKVSLDAVMGDAAPLSYRDAKTLIQDRFTRQLKGAPFSLKVLYTPAGAEPGGEAALPACDLCPKRAGNDDEAKADGVRADVCLDPDCYRAKVEAYRALETEKAEKKGAVPAPEEFAWQTSFGEHPMAPKGWCLLDAVVTGTEIGGEFPPGKAPPLTLAKVLGKDCPQQYLAFHRDKPWLLVKTADARRTLQAGGVLKKPERAKPKAEKPAPKVNQAWLDEANRKPPPGFTQEEWDRQRAASAATPSTETGPNSAGAATEKPPLLNVFEVENRTALVAADRCRTMLLANAESLAALSENGGPDTDAVYEALSLSARTLVYDWLEYGDDRREAVARFIPAAGTLNKNRDRAAADTAIAGMTPAEVVGLILGLTVSVALTNAHHWGKLFAEEMIAYADTNEADCEAQARRELAGGEPADAKLAAAEAAESPIDEPPDRNTVEGALHRAIHCYEGAAERWAKVKAAGATDAELKDQIGEALGSEGGSYGPGGLDVQYKGGKSPAVWIGDVLRTAKPTLTGKPLVDKVREVLGIPLPKGEPPPAAAAPVMLADIDVPDAVLDLIGGSETVTAAEAWATCQDATPELAALPPRNRLMAWLVKLGAKAKPADQAAEAIARALFQDAGKEGAA